MSLAHSTGPERWPTHRLLSIAARLDELRINRNLTHLGLTKGSLDVLESVAELEPVTVSDLAALLCVSKQSMGRVVHRLQGLGFLSMERSDDRRYTDIRLTHHGRKALATAAALVQRLTESRPDTESALRLDLERYIRDLRM
ncbi:MULTISPECIES: MarR family winged helix-turn-helix transcriptional regulator [unclassified Arthrobacter]|jgi:DNA-binding MarR family transcriptional regulator|uniref:MarR family winged helix-turn-helix transcriptional regulator n=1 Tax=unclassified Arthrobacter TaxID=235627 RepID=UPI001F0264B8|nr:MarR family transcriptional regulator [Arthrobacter sp. FW305-BF8]UKA53568.1 MarR family transcriptional regulator [Arthrobacter sp. FW305-BF8]